MQEYVSPKGPRIDRYDETERLYQLEEKRSMAIRNAAEELAKVFGHSKEEFWYVTMPEELMTVLDNYTPELSKVAAEAYLRIRHKATITYPTE